MRFCRISLQALRTDLTDGDMRTNGVLIGISVQGAGVNKDGEPMGGTIIEDAPIPCAIVTNTDNRKGVYEDGEFRQASYTILIEEQAFHHDRIKLQRGREELGEFRVLRAMPLLTVGRVEILV